MGTITYFENQEGYDYLELDECVLYYKQNKSDYLLGAIMYKLKEDIKSTLRKVCDRDKEDLLELIETNILEGLEYFDVNRNKKFKSYAISIIHNSLSYHYRKLKHINETNSLNYTTSHKEENVGEVQDTIAYEGHEMENVESTVLLSQIKSELTYNEYKVCEILIKDTHKLTQVEIGKELGLTGCAIKLIYKRLQKYFVKKKIVEKY